MPGSIMFIGANGTHLTSPLLNVSLGEDSAESWLHAQLQSLS